MGLLNRPAETLAGFIWCYSDKMIGSFVVYALTCPRCGCPRYVGQSQDFSQRLGSHLRGIKSKDNCVYKKHWVQSLLDAGMIPGHVILTSLPSRAGLPEAEIYWIKFFRERGCPLTNLTDGGDGGTLGKKNSAETIEKRVAHFRGVPKSPETRAKIAAALTGRPSPKKGRPMTPEQLASHAIARAIPPFQDQHGRVYKTLKEAAEQWNIPAGNICNVLKGKRKSAGGLVFSYIDPAERPAPKPQRILLTAEAVREFRARKAAP